MTRPWEAADAAAAYRQRGEAAEGNSAAPAAGGPDDEAPVTVRDKRRVHLDAAAGTDGAGGAPATSGAAAAGGTAAEVAQLQALVAERTADAQRLKAEFDNFRRRNERERATLADHAAAKVISAVLPALDDIERARQHGELEGGFKSVAESLERALSGLGLQRYGSIGEPFDHARHHALAHITSPDVTETAVVEVYRHGYTFGGRVLRPADVVTADPAEPGPDAMTVHPDPDVSDAAAGTGTTESTGGTEEIGSDESTS